MPVARNVPKLADLMLLPEDEKRRQLLALLQAEACSQKPRKSDRAWRMPELTADGRTASAGPSFSFAWRCAEVEMAAEVWARLAEACRLLFVNREGSSWLPAEARPRCLPEAVAAAVFARHTAGASYDPARSGAEWWAQVRHSGHEEEAVQFHWDTDEAAVEQHGVNLHPHLSTVTYLTDCGAPTLVLDRRNTRRPQDVASTYGPMQSGALSYPRRGKHLVFDGQLLHGTVPRRCCVAGERVTFLVNVWLDHRPSHCHRAPRAFARRLGAEREVAVSEPTDLKTRALPRALGNGGGGGCQGCDLFEAKFSRQWGWQRLCVPLPVAGVAEGTEVLEWPEGSGARLWSAV